MRQLPRPARHTAVLLLLLVVAGCGGSESKRPSDAAGASSCGTVTVPGHRADNVRATGVGCSTAKTVAAAAEGRNRAPYDAAGFSCKPSDAPDGDTDYACAFDDRRVTFRYGTG